MKLWERWSFGILTLIVAATGFAYLWMKYFMESGDPMAVVNHPWQPAMFSLHVIDSPLLLLVFGVILNSHIMRKLGGLKGSANRRTGLMSLAAFGTMTMSGYGLQVITSDTGLAAAVAIHIASGVLFSAVYLSHLMISVRINRARTWRGVRDVA
jgi:hypothetical protein